MASGRSEETLQTLLKFLLSSRCFLHIRLFIPENAFCSIVDACVCVRVYIISFYFTCVCVCVYASQTIINSSQKILWSICRSIENIELPLFCSVSVCVVSDWNKEKRKWILCVCVCVLLWMPYGQTTRQKITIISNNTLHLQHCFFSSVFSLGFFSFSLLLFSSSSCCWCCCFANDS